MDVTTQFPAILPAPSCAQKDWFATAILPHEPALRAFLRARFSSLADPDDIIQETYIRILRAHAREQIRSPKALLFTTARNLAFDRFRSARSSPAVSLANFDQLPVIEEAPTLAEHLARDAHLALLEEAINSLPPRCREVVLLKKIHGHSYDEIARRLNISHNTISAQITLGVARVRDFFRAHGAPIPRP